MYNKVFLIYKTYPIKRKTLLFEIKNKTYYLSVNVHFTQNEKYNLINNCFLLTIITNIIQLFVGYIILLYML